MIQRILLLCLAGASGTLCRYALAGFVHRFVGTTFPWGTLAVNVTGCFAAGLMWSFFEHRWVISGESRVIIMIGFLGAFTTFSTFILESGELIRTTQYVTAAVNLIFQNGLGLLALMAGITLGRLA